jgi:hypothetical protein
LLLTEKDKVRRGEERRWKWREERGEGVVRVVREVRAPRRTELKCGVWRRRRSFDILAERNLCAETEEDGRGQNSKEKKKEKGQVSSTSSGFWTVTVSYPCAEIFLFGFWKFLRAVDL